MLKIFENFRIFHKCIHSHKQWFPYNDQRIKYIYKMGTSYFIICFILHIEFELYLSSFSSCKIIKDLITSLGL